MLNREQTVALLVLAAVAVAVRWAQAQAKITAPPVVPVPEKVGIVTVEPLQQVGRIGNTRPPANDGWMAGTALCLSAPRAFAPGCFGITWGVNAVTGAVYEYGNRKPL